MSDMGHHGGHGGHLHAGHGGDGAGFSHSVGVTHGQQNHSFLSHLLGLDHDAAGHHGHHGHSLHQGVPTDQSPQGSASWSSPLQALKVSDLFQGINVTPNVMFLALFAGFAVWLGVIYWVRHHEPFANQVLGSTGGYSRTAQADRQIVAGMRHAVPIRTGSSTGAVYVPMSGTDSQPPSASAGVPAAPAGGVTAAPVNYPSSVEPPANMTSMSAVPPVSAPAMPTTSAPQLSAPAAGSSLSSYMVSVRTADGLRVKTITNR